MMSSPKARSSGNEIHRVVENAGGICERELSTFRKYASVAEKHGYCNYHCFH
jgi:hypothetical protein